MEIYLIRHAESLPRDGMDYETSSKVSLSECGKKQLKSLRRVVSKLQFDALFVSPLQRTKETAEVISQIKNIYPMYDERLKEHIVSLSATGKKYKEIKNMTRREVEWKPEDGESLTECALRMDAVMKEALKDNKKSIVVVSHALIISAFLRVRAGVSGVPKIKETSITKLSYEDGVYKVFFVSRLPFLEQVRRKLLSLL